MSLAGRSGESSESTELLASFRSTVAIQAKDLEDLRTQIAAIDAEVSLAPCGLSEKRRLTTFLPFFSQRNASQQEVAALKEELEKAKAEIVDTKAQKLDADKEQEDLLVLLEEISAKRKADKVKMRAAQLDVSEDEEEDDSE